MSWQELSQEETERIDAFLNQDLSKAEQEAFLDEVNNNPEWAAKVKSQKLLRIAIQEYGLKKSLDQFHLETKNSPQLPPTLNSNGKKNIKWFWLTGLVAFLLIGGFFMLQNTNVPNLYQQYYKVDPGLMTTMGESDNYEFERGMVDFKEQAYDKAIQRWQPLLQQQPNNDTLSYFMGIAFQVLGKEQKAETFLQPITQKSNSVFFKDANWYLGLLKIKQNKSKEAIPFLQKSEYKKSAELIKRINDLPG
ncbi:MAG TPA: hypothetical protein PKX92_08020 [Edaphocola sp.]|nr:hypothetical protein [Edaphocola sp.]